jgi:hypothetical protein
MIHALRSVRGFIHEHDDMPAFHATYCVLTALVAAMFNLGAFALLIVFHVGLDLVKYREVHGFGWLRTWRAAARESLVDLTLLCLGLTFAVYLHHSLPHIAALSGLVLAEISLIHFTALFGAKLKILSDVLGVFMHLEHYMAIRHPRIAKPFSHLERVCMLTVTVSLFLIAVSSLTLRIDMASVAEILLREMVPGVV